MVRHHVAQGAGVFVEAAAGLDAHGLGRRDLHVADVIAVPSGSKMPLAKRSTRMFWTVSLPRK